MSERLLLEGLTMRFGGLTAVSDLDLEVKPGGVSALIGPNGAGKTTVFNCVTGFIEPTTGRISLGSKDVTGKPPHIITRSGIARTFQNIRLFPNMTALENVLVGADAQHSTSVPGALMRSPRHRREEVEGRRKAEEVMSFVEIYRRADDLARNLSYGDQRRLEIARALATIPKVMLLDEPTAGMNRVEKSELMALITRLSESGLTILLIEHDMKVVMEISQRITVLNFGKKIAEGTAAEIQRNPDVITAYLGESAGAA